MEAVRSMRCWVTQNMRWVSMAQRKEWMSMALVRDHLVVGLAEVDLVLEWAHDLMHLVIWGHGDHALAGLGVQDL